MKRIYKKIRQFVRAYKIALLAILLVVVIVGLWVVTASAAPSQFPRNAIIRIEKDMTVSEAATLFKEKGLIKSSFVYKTYVTLLNDGKGIQAGSYLFDEPQSALRVAYRTTYGIKNIDKIRLTVFEGMNSKEITSLVKKAIPALNSGIFSAQAKLQEGYLFPETYFVDPDIQATEIVSLMTGQFNAALEPLREAIATSTHSLKDIIIMASIIEEEASNSVDRRMISGILWKRLEKGMALQVDVPFYYIFNKGGNPLTLNDLATTSPYNTYIHKGLPPAPISNPGLDAIRAALYPTPSPYYFYLADRKGVTHYATTHEGHVANKARYLQ
jgi:UPF0755 protein